MKGVTLSLTLVLLAFGLLSILAIHRGMILHRGERVYIERRIEDLRLTQESILRDFGKALDIIAGRAMAAAIGHVITTGDALDDARLRLKELMLNGTLNQTIEPLMEDATLPYWMDRMVEVAGEKGYELSIACEGLRIKPWDSWNLLMECFLWINLTDRFGIANLTRGFHVKELVSIEGQEDPLYPLNTLGRAVNAFKRTPHDGNYTIKLVSGTGAGWTYGMTFVSLDAEAVNAIPNPSQAIVVVNFSLPADTADDFLGVVSEVELPALDVPYLENALGAIERVPNSTYVLLDGEAGAAWYIENLREHIANSWYQVSSHGASFLDRLEGSLQVQPKHAALSPNPIGLESFVDKDYLASLGLVVRVEQTNLDYLYFNQTDVPSWGVKGLDPYFRIDNETSLGLTHLIVYGVTEILL